MTRYFLQIPGSDTVRAFPTQAAAIAALRALARTRADGGVPTAAILHPESPDARPQEFITDPQGA